MRSLVLNPNLPHSILALCLLWLGAILGSLSREAHGQDEAADGIAEALDAAVKQYAPRCPEQDGLWATFAEGVGPVRCGTKWGYMDAMGTMIIRARFDRAFPFHEGYAAVAIKDKYGFINHTGTVMIPCIYDEADSFNEGTAAVRMGGKWQFITTQGHSAFDGRFDSALAFGEGKAVVSVEDKFGFVDHTGRFTIQPKFDSANGFSEGLAAAVLGKTAGYIDANGRFAVDGEYTLTNPFQEGFACVKSNDRGSHVIDHSGRVVFVLAGEVGPVFHEGFAPLLDGQEQRWGFADNRGAVTWVAGAQYLGDICEGLAVVCVGGKFGYVSAKGATVIAPQFDAAYDFSEGLAYVRLGDKRGYIDRGGHTIWPKLPTPEDGVAPDDR
jgi:hypothetical protein